MIQIDARDNGFTSEDFKELPQEYKGLTEFSKLVPVVIDRLLSEKGYTNLAGAEGAFIRHMFACLNRAPEGTFEKTVGNMLGSLSDFDPGLFTGRRTYTEIEGKIKDCNSRLSEAISYLNTTYSNIIREFRGRGGFSIQARTPGSEDLQSIKAFQLSESIQHPIAFIPDIASSTPQTPQPLLLHTLQANFGNTTLYPPEDDFVICANNLIQAVIEPLARYRGTLLAAQARLDKHELQRKEMNAIGPQI